MAAEDHGAFIRNIAEVPWRKFPNHFGGALSPLSYILVLSAIEMGAPLSLVAPAREMSMMVGAMFGMLILRERVNGWRLIGCAILILGVVLLGAA